MAQSKLRNDYKRVSNGQIILPLNFNRQKLKEKFRPVAGGVLFPQRELPLRPFT